MAEAIFGVIKGTAGTVIMYLPKGFQQAGWAFAIPALVVATFAYIYSAQRLLQGWKIEMARQQFLARHTPEIFSLLENYDKGKDKECNKMGDERDGLNQLVSGIHTSRRAESSDAFKQKLLTYLEMIRLPLDSFLLSLNSVLQLYNLVCVWRTWYLFPRTCMQAVRHSLEL